MKLTLLCSIVALFAVSAFVGAVYAEEVTMPILYNAEGVAVNTGDDVLPEGYYFLDAGGNREVYYYGDGTYYDLTTANYHGNSGNPTGKAGVFTVNDTEAGVPNTGVGSASFRNWATFAMVALVVLAGGAYFVVLNRRENLS